jgi:hypothetical protein
MDTSSLEYAGYCREQIETLDRRLSEVAEKRGDSCHTITGIDITINFRALNACDSKVKIELEHEETTNISGDLVDRLLVLVDEHKANLFKSMNELVDEYIQKRNVVSFPLETF